MAKNGNSPESLIIIGVIALVLFILAIIFISHHPWILAIALGVVIVVAVIVILVKRNNGKF